MSVSCTISPSVYLNATNDTSGAPQTSGCQVIDVHIHKPYPERIGMIRFRNYYTQSMTILYQDGGGVSTWKPCIINHMLMYSWHNDEKGAEKWVEFTGAHFATKLDCVTTLRFILKQPSPHWKQYGIQQLECYHDNRLLPQETNQPFPTAQSMRKNDQNFISHHSNSNTALPYEINLLSCT